MAELPGLGWLESWPAYRVSVDSPLVQQFLDAAQEVFGRAIPARVRGPSNIGNSLASRGIPALCGFGVTYDNQHAVDENAELETVMPVYETYHKVIDRLLNMDDIV